MRLPRVVLALSILVSTAGAQWHENAVRTQPAPTAARVALEQMSPTERKNSLITVEFESSDDQAVALGREVEQLWNGGECDAALAQLAALEARTGRVAIGNSWRTPVPTTETECWGRDVRIGNRDSLLELAFEADPASGNLFVALRRGKIPHFSLCMSADGGMSWEETFTWSGSPPTSIGAAVLGNRLFVIYNSPAENAQQVRLRRFLCSNGKADTFAIGTSWVAACTLEAGDTMREASIVSNQSSNRLYNVILVSDGSVLASYDDANAVSWTGLSTGISSGAGSGLDAAQDESSDTTYIFFSYYDTSDTLRVYGRSGQRLSLPAGRGTPTSISAYSGAVICAYEDETSSPHQVRYAANYGVGDTWKRGTLSDGGTAAEAAAITMIEDEGYAAIFRQDAPTGELRFRRRTRSGLWSDPATIAENEPHPSRPGIVCLGGGLFGVAYLSDSSPVVREAYFDRSDWVYGIAERSRLRDSGDRPQATVVRGVLSLRRGMAETSDPSNRVPRPILLDIGGRKVLDLMPGANDVRALAPGVYFVYEGGESREQGGAGTLKVVVAR